MIIHKVPVTTLDGYFEDKDNFPDFVKIDVEGFEAFVLKGASDVLAQCNATILMETDDGFLKYNGSSARELISILQGYGYRTFYRSDKHCFVEQNDDLINCHFDLLCTKK